jgi:hypothetical protein
LHFRSQAIASSAIFSEIIFNLSNNILFVFSLRLRYKSCSINAQYLNNLQQYLSYSTYLTNYMSLKLSFTLFTLSLHLRSTTHCNWYLAIISLGNNSTLIFANLQEVNSCLATMWQYTLKLLIYAVVQFFLSSLRRETAELMLLALMEKRAVL